MSRTDGSPAAVAVTIELTDQQQAIILDTLAGYLSQRIARYAGERQDFRLAAAGETPDLRVRLRVTELTMVDVDRQYRWFQQREEVLAKYDAINDSNRVWLERQSPGHAAAGRAIAAVVAGMLRGLSYAITAIVVPPSSRKAAASGPELLRAAGPPTSASIALRAWLVTADGKVKWKGRASHTVDLVTVANPVEQLHFLARDAVLGLEGRLPLLRLPK